VLDCNENYCSLTGFTLEEMQGKDTRQFRKPDEIKQLDIIFTEVLKGKIYHGVIKRTKPTGEESWIVANFYPRKKQHEQIERVICFAQDITEKKLRYKLLEEANKEIERLKAQLETGQSKKAE
jgi:methyl-accepting chemotaxis protein